MKKFLIAMTVLALVGACTETAQQTAMRQQKDYTACSYAGYQAGTTAHGVCLQQREQAYINKVTAQRQTVAAAIVVGAAAASASQRSYTPPSRGPVMCRSHRFGNTVTTHCN